VIADGRDPGIEAQKLKTGRSAAANTFEIVARGWYALQKERWHRSMPRMSFTVWRRTRFDAASRNEGGIDEGE
jgi:hypothetical protein